MVSALGCSCFRPTGPCDIAIVHTAVLTHVRIQNHIFVVRNAGFVAYAIEGSYDVLAIVDQTHLHTPVKDNTTGAILGW